MVLKSTLYDYRDDLQLEEGEFLGGKTGHTSRAGLCLASLARIKGKEYILVTAGADEDMDGNPGYIADAEKIYGNL